MGMGSRVHLSQGHHQPIHTISVRTGLREFCGGRMWLLSLPRLEGSCCSTASHCSACQLGAWVWEIWVCYEQGPCCLPACPTVCIWRGGACFHSIHRDS